MQAKAGYPDQSVDYCAALSSLKKQQGIEILKIITETEYTINGDGSLIQNPWPLWRWHCFLHFKRNESNE